jgi:hypothetical protein
MPPQIRTTMALSHKRKLLPKMSRQGKNIGGLESGVAVTDKAPEKEQQRPGEVDLDFPFGDGAPTISFDAPGVDLPEVEPEAPKPAKQATGRKPQLRVALERFYENIGGLTLMFDPVCGQVIIDNAPRTAEAMNELARQDIKIRRILERLVETSALGTVIAAHAPIALVIYTHHMLPFIARRQQVAEGENREAGEAGTAPGSPATGNGEPPVYSPPPGATLGAGFVGR